MVGRGEWNQTSYRNFDKTFIYSDPSTEVNPLTTAAYLNTVDANVMYVKFSVFFVINSIIFSHLVSLIGASVRNSTMNLFDVNLSIIVIGAGSINYITSRNRVGITGDHVAAFMDILHAAGHILNFNQVTCVG